MKYTHTLSPSRSGGILTVFALRYDATPEQAELELTSLQALAPGDTSHLAASPALYLQASTQTHIHRVDIQFPNFSYPNFSYSNTINPTVAHANLDNLLTTPLLVTYNTIF